MSEYSVPTSFIDLEAQQKSIRPQLEKAIKKVLNHGKYIMGPEVLEFEKELKKFTGSNNAITCANGTDALTIPLMAWGFGPGDAVFVPSFTYVATAEAPAQLGATPFFVDVHKNSFNINTESLKQAISDCRKSNLKPAAIIAVDLFGQPCEIDTIIEIAHSENIKVIVDGAQSFGASSKGRKVGSLGDVTTTSFFPAKPLGCYGDGGAVFTNDDGFAEVMRSIRLHGKGSEKYDNVRLGLNSRLDTLQAAILIEKLKIFPDELIKRDDIANIYSSGLTDKYIVPKLSKDIISSWAQYTLISENRDKIIHYLKEKLIPTAIYYPKPLSKQIGYNHYPSVSTGTPVSHFLADRVFSIPMHPYMEHKQAENIVSILNNFDDS